MKPGCTTMARRQSNNQWSDGIAAHPVPKNSECKNPLEKFSPLGRAVLTRLWLKMTPGCDADSSPKQPDRLHAPLNPLIQCVPGAHSQQLCGWGVALSTHLQLGPKINKAYSCTSIIKALFTWGRIVSPLPF